MRHYCSFHWLGISPKVHINDCVFFSSSSNLVHLQKVLTLKELQLECYAVPRESSLHWRISALMILYLTKSGSINIKQPMQNQDLEDTKSILSDDSKSVLSSESKSVLSSEEKSSSAVGKGSKGSKSAGTATDSGDGDAEEEDEDDSASLGSSLVHGWLHTVATEIIYTVNHLKVIDLHCPLLPVINLNFQSV